MPQNGPKIEISTWLYMYIGPPYIVNFPFEQRPDSRVTICLWIHESRNSKMSAALVVVLREKRGRTRTGGERARNLPHVS